MTGTCIPTFCRRNAAAGAMTAVLDEAGIAWTITFGGRHPKLRFEHGGRQHSHPISISPGDPHAHKFAARDIRRILAGYGESPSEQLEPDMETASTGSEIVLSEIGLIPHDGEPRARDVDIAGALGFERPRKIRDLINRHRDELETFGGIAPHRGAKIGRGRPEEGYLLNEEQSLLIAAVSDAPNAPAVRAMLIRTFVAWRRGQLQPVGGGEDVGALLDLMGEQFDRVISAIAAKGGLSEEDMKRLLRQHCEWEQRQHGRLRDEVHAGAGRVIKTLRNEPASASLGDDVDLDAGYRACGIEGPIPARRKLSARVTNMVDAYCRKHRIPVGQIVVRGVEVKVWPRTAFQSWFAEEGSTFVGDHIRRATAGAARPGDPNVIDLFSPQPSAR
jgi:hypothetical protein